MTPLSSPAPPRQAAHWLATPQPLISHPATPCGTSLAVGVSVKTAPNLPGGGWCLRFELRGDLSALLIPAPAAPGPADGLWQHTCFEAFVAERGAATYQEFNFSPSGQWATYLFSAERVRDTVAESDLAATSPIPPAVAWHCTPEAFVLEAWLPASALHISGSGQTLDIGLTAVIETRDHQLTYWALHHPCAKPDFHNRQGFVLPMPAAPQAPHTPTHHPSS